MGNGFKMKSTPF